jgi:hypothetical protein
LTAIVSLYLQQTISFNKVTDLCRRSGALKH